MREASRLGFNRSNLGGCVDPLPHRQGHDTNHQHPASVSRSAIGFRGLGWGVALHGPWRTSRGIRRLPARLRLSHGLYSVNPLALGVPVLVKSFTFALLLQVLMPAALLGNDGAAGVAQAPQIRQSAPVPPPTSAEPIPQPSMRPMKQVSLETLRAAVRAQEAPNTPSLTKAWEFYKKFQGSWKPKAPKPAPDDLATFDAFKTEQEKIPLPDWFVQLEEKEGKPVPISMSFDPSSPDFSKFRQNEETQHIKTLGIIYLTEHELDRKGAAEKGATTISILITRTYFDHELHALFARFLADAKVPAIAMQEAILGIYLNPAPTRQDLEFAAFVMLPAASKDGWGAVQTVLREAASKPEDAEVVIQKWGSKLQKGDLKFINVPGPK